MQITSTQMKPVSHRVSPERVEPSEPGPSENMTFSAGEVPWKPALTLVAAAGAGVAGFVMGNNGGWTGAVTALPAAGVTAAGAGALGLISDAHNGGTSNDGAKMLLAGGAVGGVMVAAGAFGGVVGGLVVGACSALAAATVVGGMIAD